MNSTTYYTVCPDTDVDTSDTTEPYEIDYPSTEEEGDERDEDIGSTGDITDVMHMQMLHIMNINNTIFSAREDNSVSTKNSLIVYERIDEKDHSMRNENESCPVCYETYKIHDWLVYCTDCKNGLHEKCWNKCTGSNCIICRKSMKHMHKYQKIKT